MTTNIVASQYPLAQQAFDFVGSRLPDNISLIEGFLDSLDLDIGDIQQLKDVVSTAVCNAEHSAFIAGFMFRQGLDGVPCFAPVDGCAIEKQEDDTDKAKIFISTLNQLLESGLAYIKENALTPGDGECIGWIDDEGNINLYPVMTMNQLYNFNHDMRGITPNAIYRQMKSARYLAKTGVDTSTKVTYSPEGKSVRVLVLKPEALNIGQ